ncbi:MULTISPECIES: HAAS signaling domain-containing protein [unclassified Streptomyces]|uniref:HAAS signaling domain-containing protein n=1 Tax=unclassified Streptomyces TaxID=2593676 RepID=UPI0004BE5233|nr:MULTISPECIES: membrane protein [unclassified Streptomyces]
MGIESDQVVYEYLSRVADLAQRQLPSADRMRLVAGLRDEIDRRRGRTAVDSPAAVRRIIDRLGSPDAVVAAAGGSPGVAAEPPASVPVQRAEGPEPSGPAAGKRLRKVLPRPRSGGGKDAGAAVPGAPSAPPSVPADPRAPSPPHLAGTHELGDTRGAPPDWWRKEVGSFDLGDSVPGFVGGVEIPELLRAPGASGASGASGAPKAPEAPAVPAAPGEPVAAPTEKAARRARLPRLSGRQNPLLLFAAVLLVVGAVLGSWIALGLGWIIAYASRRLTPAEVKWAVMVLPGTVVAAGAVWLWGRSEGRWGEAIAKGHMNDAVAETWPWVVRGAAVASALYVAWRSQKSR